ncbi:molybdate ABC transporter substrate-binding protein [Muricoccus pecuniae]|uniref:Molybdate transport system substrate-binding protein n=1 Tax=Muricoccus pecuniae TaxID=693023 RepID=A0A840XW87_9PROT|nr:substrate-binding domain-containing protein [Roseomonas pecuniae]MBB5692785.1 molybdate transport system substrate-binding protein [Roseomonas pecuniae]
MTLHLLSTLAVAGAMRGLLGRCEAAAGMRVTADFMPTLGLLARIRGGERADAVVLTAEGVEELIAEGVLDPASRADLVRSHIGLAVRAGEPHPRIGTVDELKEALLAAPSVAYSRTGASGIAFAALLGRLGIAEAVNARATIVPSGFTAEPLVRGEASLAVQQVSELLAVPGIEVIGRLPREVETVAVFTAAAFRGAAQPEAAGRLIRFLASGEAAPALREAGLEPVAEGLASAPPAPDKG